MKNSTKQMASLAVMAMTAVVGVSSSSAVTIKDFTTWANGQITAITGTKIDPNEVTGTLKVCTASELAPWIKNDVSNDFGVTYKKVTLLPIHANGSGELADSLNAGNTTERCDLVIFGSNVSALRWNGFSDKDKRNIGYSPTVWVGRKDKLDAARKFLGKEAGAKLDCNDLVKVSQKRRMNQIVEGGTGKLALEMSTSNSGQTMYFSCLFTALNAYSPQEVATNLDKAKGSVEQDIETFMSKVDFSEPKTGTVTDKFLSGSQGLGSDHLAIATYESYYAKDIRKVAADNGIEVEMITPPITVLNNFPAQIVTNDPVKRKAADAFINTMLSIPSQTALVQKYAIRTATGKSVPISGPYAEILKVNVEPADLITDPKQMKSVWQIVSKVPAVQTSGVLR